MGENIRLSIRGILSHKMRSILTMLGIIIGIAAIIAIVPLSKVQMNRFKPTSLVQVLIQSMYV